MLSQHSSQGVGFVREKLSQMQESVEVYERLGLKSEFIYAYRMLIYLMFEAADYNALSRELARFLSRKPAGGPNSAPTRLTREEIVTGRDDLMRLWNGQPIIFSQETSTVI